MSEVPFWAAIVALMFGPTGAAWVSVRVALNGTRERVQRIETSVNDISHAVIDVKERVAKIEGGLGV